MEQASQSMDVLANAENIKIFSNVLKTNVAACTSIGSFYLPQIGRIFLDMLGLYKAVSGVISETVASEGTVNFVLVEKAVSDEVNRPYCDKDPESSTPSNCEKRDPSSDGDLHQESRRFRVCEC